MLTELKVQMLRVFMSDIYKLFLLAVNEIVHSDLNENSKEHSQISNTINPFDIVFWHKFRK